MANGQVFVENVNFGAVARYVCQAGYKPRGDQARVCQGDEQLSVVVPQCLIDYNVGRDTLGCKTYEPRSGKTGLNAFL